MFKKKFTVNLSSARTLKVPPSCGKKDETDLSGVEQTPPPQESGPVLEPVLGVPQPSPAPNEDVSMVDDEILAIDSTEATCSGMEFPDSDIVGPETYETGRCFVAGEQLKLTKARRDLLPRLEQIAEKFAIRDVYLKNKINLLFSKLPSCKSLEESAMAALYVCARIDRRTTGHQPITLQQVAVNSNLTIPGIGAIVSKIVDPANKFLSPEDLEAYYGQVDFSGWPLPPFEVQVKGVENCVRDIRKLTEKIVTKVSAMSSHYLDRNSTKMAAAFIAYKSICYNQKAAPISRQKFFDTFKLEGTGINFPSVTNMDKQIREDLLLLAQGMSGAKKTGTFLAQNLSEILDNGNDSANDTDVGPSTPLPVYSSFERPISLQTQMKGLNQEEIALLMTQGIGDSNEDEMKMYLIEDEQLAQFKEDKMRAKKRRTEIDAPAFSDAGQPDEVEDSMSD